MTLLQHAILTQREIILESVARVEERFTWVGDETMG